MDWRARNDKVEALLTATRSQRAGWVRVNCPFCPAKLGKTDRKQALAINSVHGGWLCWRCGTHGKLRNPPDATGEVVAAPKVEAFERPESYHPLWTGDGATAEVFKPARDYLAGRGVTPALCAAAQIGACYKGRYAKRVVVPVLSPTAPAWLGYVTRTWYEGADRPYLNVAGMERLTLYNHAALLQKTDEPVLVVEGVFDALAYWPDAVAVLGKPTETQIDALAEAPRPVCAVLDGDAWPEAFALAARLRCENQRAGWVKLPPGVDPDEFDRSELRRLARESLGKSF